MTFVVQGGQPGSIVRRAMFRECEVMAGRQEGSRSSGRLVGDIHDDLPEVDVQEMPVHVG